MHILFYLSTQWFSYKYMKWPKMTKIVGGFWKYCYIEFFKKNLGWLWASFIDLVNFSKLLKIANKGAKWQKMPNIFKNVILKALEFIFTPLDTFLIIFDDYLFLLGQFFGRFWKWPKSQNSKISLWEKFFNFFLNGKKAKN